VAVIRGADGLWLPLQGTRRLEARRLLELRSALRAEHRVSHLRCSRSGSKAFGLLKLRSYGTSHPSASRASHFRCSNSVRPRSRPGVATRKRFAFSRTPPAP